MEKFTIKCLITAEETGGKVAVFEEVVRAKSGPPLHIHKNQLEIFHVIQGDIRFRVGEEEVDVSSGGTAVVPAGAPHTFFNLSEAKAIIHFELLPAGQSERFFEKLTTGAFDDPAKLFEDHDLELLGPPMG